jgi:hypothetical protein
MGPETSMPKTKDKPAHEVRIGAVKAAIWKNDTSNGVRYNTTFSRLYKDKEEDEWRSTDSFGRDDLLVLAKVADGAHTWIFGQAQEKNGESET